MESINIEELINQALTIIAHYGWQLVGAIITLLAGLWIIKRINNLILRAMEKSNLDPSLRTFLKSFASIALKILLVISVGGMVGVEMTSFIAILGAAGIAVGLALSGTLQNFAGGVIILIFKPYKVGDVINAQGFTGAVKAIQIFNTILTTPDNKTIIIPNGGLATGSLTNFSTEPRRRVDWVFGIAYGDDLDLAYSTLRKLISEDPRILSDPEPFLALSELADSSVNITVRVWVDAPDYWATFFSMNERVYKTFTEVGLNIPFPQRDVHIYQH